MRNSNFSEQLMILANQNVKEKKYWTEKLSGSLSKSIIPYDYNKISENINFNTYQLEIPLEIGDRLLKISKGSNDALHMILMAGLFIYINKTTGNDDIIIGTPIYKIENPQQLINTILPIREKIDKDDTFKQILIKLKDVIKDADSNANYPIELLTTQLEIDNKNSFFPLFEIALLVEGIHDQKYLEGIDINLIFSLDFNENSKVLKVIYNPSCYCLESIKRIADLFLSVMRNVLFNVDSKLSSIEIITTEEKQKLIFEFNNTKATCPIDKSIHQIFTEQVNEFPSKAALIHGNMQISYSELDYLSDLLASHLIKEGLIPSSVVGLLTERTPEMIIGILSILKCGCIYLPLDVDYPVTRLEYMVKDCNVKLVLVGSGLGVDVSKLCKLIDIKDILKLRSKIDRKPSEYYSDAYIMYTSGSTGKPKGVLVKQKGIVRLVKDINYTTLTKDSIILQTGAPAFDAITFEIWGALLNGGSLVMIGKDTLLNVNRLNSVIIENNINTLWLSSSLFNQLIQERRDVFLGIRYLLVGGDVVSSKHVKIAYENNPGIQVINCYGPTENTTFSTTYPIPIDISGDIPIGKPISNSTTYIFDYNEKLQPIGIVGELFVGGDGLAEGYINNPEMTHNRFIDNPFSIGERLYRTGDLARWLLNGNIEFIGRIDNQIKIRGFRVELSEIERSILEHSGVKDCVVIKRTENNESYICAYIVPIDPLNFTVESIREYISKRLPEYMIPSYFVQLDKIPLTTNGKVDRKVLPLPKINIDNEYCPPSNEIQTKLVKIWSEILNVPQEKISINISFFDIGGHSLRATIFANRLFEEMNVEIKLIDFFNNPTIKGISELIKNDIEVNADGDFDEISI